MQIEIRAASLADVPKRYQEAPRVVREELKVGMDRATMLVERDAKREVKRDTGNLRRSITRQVDWIGLAVRGRVGTNLPHGRPVEKGRRAGSRMPPKGVLIATGWLRRHGIPDRAEYAVRLAIARKGIKRAPYLEPALTRNLRKINDELGRKAMQRTMKRLAGGAGR